MFLNIVRQMTEICQTIHGYLEDMDMNEKKAVEVEGANIKFIAIMFTFSIY